MALTTLATVISASRGYVSTLQGESANSESELFLRPSYLRYPELFQVPSYVLGGDAKTGPRTPTKCQRIGM